MHILVFEDDLIVDNVLGMTLEETGYFKTTSDTMESALFELNHNLIDAILLDLNSSDSDGTRLARLVRKNHMPVTILVVSGNSVINDKITALVAGADKYLTKPYDRYRLVANLDTVIRRTHGHSSATVNVGNLMVDLNRNYAKIGDSRLDLPAKEFRIIEFLALRKDAFLNHLHGGIDELEPKIIVVFMCKLRRKLADAGASGVVIDTIWRQGYVLREMRDCDAMTATA